MEQKNISFGKGIHRTPSIGDAGELSESMNLIPSNGELVSIQQASSLSGDFSNYGKLIYIHERGGKYSNKIWQRTNGVYFDNTVLLANKNATSTTSVGNTLLVSTSEGVYYFRFKSGSYINLGTSIPKPELRFSLASLGIEYAPYSKINVDDCTFMPSESGGIEAIKIGSNSIGDVSNFVYSKINTLESIASKQGFFTCPFYVIYAIRLYDGSHVNISSPVLLDPNEDSCPMVVSQIAIGTETVFRMVVNAIASKIVVKNISDSDIFSKWEDIISGIDIFVSPQFQRYKEQGSVNSMINAFKKAPVSGRNFGSSDPRTIRYCSDFIGSRVICENTNGYMYAIGSFARDYDINDTWSISINQGLNGFRTYKPLEKIYSLSTDVDKNKLWTNTYSTSVITGELVLGLKEEEEYYRSIRECSNFYLLKSYNLGSMSSTPSIIETGDLDVSEIASRERLDLNYLSNDLLKPLNLLSYNSRVLYYGVSKELFSGYKYSDFTPVYESEYRGKADVVVELEYDEGKKYIRFQRDNDGFIYPHYFYFPNINAKKVYVKFPEIQGGSGFVLELKRHPFMSGAYWFDNFNYPSHSSITLPEGTDKEIDASDRIYISNVNNPWKLDEASSVTLPSNVICLSTTAKALSQGQFGQFPLYAFCEDGIWAIEIGSDGSLIAKQPISRDVLSVKSSVTQLDNAVSFVTKEGVKVISGSDVVLISEPVHGLNLKEDFIETTLGEDYAELYKVDEDNFITQIQAEGTKMCYDYAHQLIHLFLAGKDWHYVYSRKTNEWSKQLNASGNIVSIVPGYPLSTMQFGTKLYKYDIATDAKKKGFALTRSYACDNPFARKVIHDLRTIGQKHTDTSIKVAVFESNDNINWYRMKSLKGHSAKFYRFLIISNMYDTDTISGMTLLTEERYNHKLR